MGICSAAIFSAVGISSIWTIVAFIRADTNLRVCWEKGVRARSDFRGSRCVFLSCGETRSGGCRWHGAGLQYHQSSSDYVLAAQIASEKPNGMAFTGRDPMLERRQDPFKVPEAVMSIPDDEVLQLRSLDGWSMCDVP